jgi:Xaa-Pro aminopeptidase
VDRQTEYAEKRARIAALMAAHNLSGLALGRAASWSWASCGGEANVALNSEHAEATLLFTPARDYLLANRIELPRLLAEELGDLPIEPVELPWHEPARRATLAAELAGGPLGTDTPTLPNATLLAPAIAALRHTLYAPEQARLRNLGAAAGAAIEAVARAIAPGMSEQEVAGLLAAESFRRGATPVVLLVAADERSARFRHPWPTERRIERVAMLVLCARRQGLIVSATRLVHFGPPPAELRRRADACARIDTTIMLATRPGRTLGAIFTEIQAAYAAAGFADEWREHHQGGLAGYENREALALPGAELVVQAGQAYAWNPSIAGVKSEDTMLVGADGPELLTATGDWPQLEVEVDGRRMWRPAILER